MDTAAREREVEERLQKEQEKLQRQLEDDKRIDRRPRERWEWCLGKEGSGVGIIPWERWEGLGMVSWERWDG